MALEERNLDKDADVWTFEHGKAEITRPAP